MLVDFGMGATIENVHRSGSLPQRTEHLKSTVMEGVMLEAVDFSMSADILSGQQASDLFIALMDFKNFFLRINNYAGNICVLQKASNSVLCTPKFGRYAFFKEHISLSHSYFYSSRQQGEFFPRRKLSFLEKLFSMMLRNVRCQFIHGHLIHREPATQFYPNDQEYQQLNLP